jgi:hypothetical protein
MFHVQWLGLVAFLKMSSETVTTAKKLKWGTPFIPANNWNNTLEPHSNQNWLEYGLPPLMSIVLFTSK